MIPNLKSNIKYLLIIGMRRFNLKNLEHYETIHSKKSNKKILKKNRES